MSIPSRGAIALALLFLASASAAEDWLRFRGANGTGVAGTQNLPLEFSAESALWTHEIPFGRSSPIVVGSVIVMTGASDDELVTVALDADTGEERWRRSVPRLRQDAVYSESGPSVATPVSDGRSVFVFFPEFGLVSYALDGEELWRHEMPPFDNYYGLASSPVLEGDVLILQCDQQREPFIVALDKNEGELLWSKERAIGESWSTPVILHPGSDGAAVVALGTFSVDAYAVRTGEQLFSVPGLGYGPVASPVLDGTRLFMSAVDGSGGIPSTAAMFEHDEDGNAELSRSELEKVNLQSSFGWFDRDGDGIVTRAEYDETEKLYTSEDFGVVAVDLVGAEGPAIAWREKRAVPYISSPILYRGVLFLIKDGGILTSLDAKTGDVLKRARIEGAAEPFFPSPVISDGRIYLTANSGKVAVVSAEAEWELLALNDLDERIDASPAIADGRLFIRTRTRLMAFGSTKSDG